MLSLWLLCSNNWIFETVPEWWGSGKRLQTEATQAHPKGICAQTSSLSDHRARWTRLIRATWLVYSEVNVIPNLFSSVHTLFAFHYRDCLLLASPSHFQSNKTTVQRPRRHWPCTKWKAHADRQITGLSAGAHRGHCSLCALALSLLAALASSPSAALNVYTLVFGLDIKSFIMWCFWTTL